MREKRKDEIFYSLAHIGGRRGKRPGFLTEHGRNRRRNPGICRKKQELAGKNLDLQGKTWTCREKPGLVGKSQGYGASRKSEKHPGLWRDPENQRSTPGCGETRKIREAPGLGQSREFAGGKRRLRKFRALKERR